MSGYWLPTIWSAFSWALEFIGQTLGTITFAIAAAVVSFLLGIHKMGWQQMKRRLWTSIPSAAAIAFIATTVARLPWTIYKRQKAADDEIAHLSQRPALSNVSKLLEAFAVYRNVIQGADCRIEVTAPPVSEAIARIVAQLSVRTSNCPTFGPFDLQIDPDARARTMNGMQPNVIILHAARVSPGTHNLYLALQSVLPLQRSYEVPAGSPEHFVWFQFGEGVKWNSER